MRKEYGRTIQIWSIVKLGSGMEGADNGRGRGRSPRGARKDILGKINNYCPEQRENLISARSFLSHTDKFGIAINLTRYKILAYLQIRFDCLFFGGG